MLATRLMRTVVSVLLLACHPSEPPRPAAPPSTPDPARLPRTPPPDDDRDVGNRCREQVAGLEEWLHGVQAGGLPLAMSLLDEGALLVKRAGPKIVDPGPLLHATKREVMLDGMPVELPGGVSREIGKLIEMRRNMVPLSPFIASPHAYLAVDQDVVWQTVVEVTAEGAAGGLSRITFVFADPSRTVPGPPPSPIDSDLAQLARSSKQKRQQIIAEQLAYVYQDCPEGLKVIAQMGVNEVHDFKQVVLDDLPEAIGACACRPNDAAVKALHWSIFGNPQPTSGLTLLLAPPAATLDPASILALDAELPWATAQEQLVAFTTAGADRRGRLVVKKAEEVEKKKNKR